MTNTKLYKKFLAGLVLAMMALSMSVLPGCSSSEESSEQGDCYEGGPGWPDCKL